MFIVSTKEVTTNSSNGCPKGWRHACEQRCAGRFTGMNNCEPPITSLYYCQPKVSVELVSSCGSANATPYKSKVLFHSQVSKHRGNSTSEGWCTPSGITSRERTLWNVSKCNEVSVHVFADLQAKSAWNLYTDMYRCVWMHRTVIHSHTSESSYIHWCIWKHHCGQVLDHHILRNALLALADFLPMGVTQDFAIHVCSPIFVVLCFVLFHQEFVLLFVLMCNFPVTSVSATPNMYPNSCMYLQWLSVKSKWYAQYQGIPRSSSTFW